MTGTLTPTGPRSPTDAEWQEIASKLDRYDLGKMLGRGGFGIVRQAHHRKLNREFALKIIDVSGTGSHSEAEMLAKLDHNHIVKVSDYLVVASFGVIVMERLSGGTLAERSASLSQQGFCAVGLAVADGLHYAHGVNLLHLDTTPHNIMFTADVCPKVTDFGIATILDGSSAPVKEKLGTFRYMAAEQLTGDAELRPTTDVCGLGLVMFEALGGKTLLDQYGPRVRMIENPPPMPSGVPVPVADVIRRAIGPDRQQRQKTARAFALELAAAAAQSYGTRWLARSGVAVHLDDDVRETAEHGEVP